MSAMASAPHPIPCTHCSNPIEGRPVRFDSRPFCNADCRDRWKNFRRQAIASLKEEERERQRLRRIMRIVPEGEREELPEGTFVVPTSSGQWQARPGSGVYRWTASGEEGEWILAGPLPLAVKHHLVLRSPSGKATARCYGLLFSDGSEFTIKAGDLAIPQGWAACPVPMPTESRTLHVIAAAIKMMAAQVPEEDEVPAWRDGTLCLPPEGYGPAGYGERAPISAEDAEKHWRAILEIGAQHPLFALVVSAAVGGCYAAPLGRPSAIINLNGGSSEGKSTAEHVGASMLGYAGQSSLTPEGTFWTMNAAPQGLPNRIAKRGVLTTFIDEFGASDLNDEQLRAFIFRVAGGNGRIRSPRDGLGETEGLPFRSLVILSANRTLVNIEANPGLAPRIIEVPGPIIGPAADPEAHADATVLSGLAAMAYGWPFELVQESHLKEMAEFVSAADLELDAGRGGVFGRVARTQALAVGASRLVAQRYGVPEWAEAALKGAHMILAHMEVELAELGRTMGDRLHDAVLEAWATHRRHFPCKADASEAAKWAEIWGVTEERNGVRFLVIMSEPLKRIATSIRLPGDRVARRELERDGRILAGRETEHPGRMTVWAPGYGPVKGYAFVLPGLELEADPFAPKPEPIVAPAPPLEEFPPAPPAILELELPTPAPSSSSCVRCGADRLKVGAGPAGLCLPCSRGDGPGGGTPAPKPVDRPDRKPAAARLEDFARAVAQAMDDDGNPVFPDPAPEELFAALGLLERAVGGLTYEGAPPRCGITWLHAIEARSGSIPHLEPQAVDLSEIRITTMFSRTDHSQADAPGEGLTTVDVNAAYANSAQMVELGTGLPEWHATPELEVIRHPGFVLLEHEEGWPAPFDRLEEGKFLPTPLARLLVEWTERPPSILEAAIWPEHRRWLRPFAHRCLSARTELMVSGDPAAHMALTVLKRIYTSTLGGMLNSPKLNRTAFLRPDWVNLVKGQATAGLWRHLHRAEVGPAAQITDAAYFIVPKAGDVPQIPDSKTGPTFSDSPGRLKVSRTCILTDEMRQAIANGRPVAIQRAAKAGAQKERS